MGENSRVIINSKSKNFEEHVIIRYFAMTVGGGYLQQIGLEMTFSASTMLTTCWVLGPSTLRVPSSSEMQT